MHLPAEIIDLITFYVEIGNLRSTSIISTARFQLAGDKTRHDLAQLRLVNRSFCRSASARLFRHIVALAGPLSHTRHLPSLAKLVNLSNSSYTQYVRQIDLGYGAFPYSTGDVTLYTEDLAGVLSSSLRQFPYVKAIYIRGPPPQALPYDKTRSSTELILRSLCYVPLPHLTELELRLPMTNDFAILFPENISQLRIPIDQLLKRLSYLGLHVYAQTNQQAGVALLLNIIELSTSLTSLSISSTNHICVDHLQLGSAVRLRYLSLSKVKVSSLKLVHLIQQCERSIRYIEFRHVKIECGSWSDVLSALNSLDSLLDFHISECVHEPRPGLFDFDQTELQKLKEKAQLNRKLTRNSGY